MLRLSVFEARQDLSYLHQTLDSGKMDTTLAPAQSPELFAP